MPGHYKQFARRRRARPPHFPRHVNERSPSLAFIHHFDRVYARIVDDRHKRKYDLALRVRLNSSEYFIERAVAAARFFEDIEIPSQSNAVAEHVKCAVARAAARGLLRSEPRFRK